jgi:hypothetical protein
MPERIPIELKSNITYSPQITAFPAKHHAYDAVNLFNASEVIRISKNKETQKPVPQLKYNILFVGSSGHGHRYEKPFYKWVRAGRACQ